MSTPRFVLAEIWTEFECAGGVARCAIPDLIRASRVQSLPTAGENELTFEIPHDSLAWPYIQERAVVRLIFKDQVTGTASFDEYRIQAIEEIADRNGYRSSITAVAPEVDLGTLTPVFRTEGDGSRNYAFTPDACSIAQHLSEFILPALAAVGVTHFATGSISPTAVYPLVYNWSTPLDAIAQLAADAKCEWRVRRNGTTQYLIDIMPQIAGTSDPLGQAPKLYLQFAKNLRGVRRQRSADSMATEMYARGQPIQGEYPLISLARWFVTNAPSSTRAVLVDPLGGDGPILEDDQLNNLYVRKWPSGPWIQVSDSSLSAQEITTASPHGLVASDFVQFAADSGGGALTLLHSPSGRAAYGRVHKYLDRPDIPGHTNLVANPAMRTYSTSSNAPPDAWKVIPGCGLSVNNTDREQTTGRWRVGGQSCKVVTANDGQGIETDWATVDVSDDRPHLSGYGGYWLDTNGSHVRTAVVIGNTAIPISGTPTRSTASGVTTVVVNSASPHGLSPGSLVEIIGLTGGTTADGYNGIHVVSRVLSTTQIEYQLSADPGTVSVSSATTRQVYRFASGGDGRAKRWCDIGPNSVGDIGSSAKSLGAVAAKVQVMQDGSTGLTMYVDLGQLTVGKGEGNLPFLEGCGPLQLWQALNRSMTFRRGPSARYDVDLVDLARLDSWTWPYDDVILGQVAEINQPLLGGPVTTRILQRGQVLKDKEGDEAVTDVVMSNRDGDLTDELLARARHDRPPPPPPPLANKRLRTVKIGAAAFKGRTGADVTALQFFASGDGFSASGPTVSATADAPLLEADLHGKRIRAIRFACQAVPSGTATLVLNQDGSSVATITSSGSGTFSRTGLDLAGEGFSYNLAATVTPNGGVTTVTFYWAEVDVEETSS